MKNTGFNKIRFMIAAVVFIAVMLCCAFAAAETAKDITKDCKFNAGSGRTGDNAFAKCTDRNYKTFWKTGNGPKGFVEVTVPGGHSASGVMVQFYEHPHAWGIQVKNENGETIDKKWVLPKYYNATEENEIVFEFDGEYNDEYSVSVTAETAYGISSDPLESTSESKAKVNVFVKFFNMIARFFTNLIEKIKSWF